MVKVVPELDDINRNTQTWVPTKEEETRGKRVDKRITEMLDHRAPYESAFERSILMYEGIKSIHPKARAKFKNEMMVAPFARTFVEAKTAEEVKAFSEYKLVPVEDSGDSWKVELLREVNTHVRRVVKQKPKRQQLIRMKNIIGVSIARIGYRRILGMRKIRTQSDEHGDIMAWKEVPVPIYDDIFMDVVSPQNFAVDPNATSMDDAMDCVHFHPENYEVFWEVYANDPKFKNIKDVIPGSHGRMMSKGFQDGAFRSQQAKENMVVITEYFNKIRDEWLVYANGVEIYFGPLPDDHKELPFISYHNAPGFVTGFFDGSRTTADGEEVAHDADITFEETFWTRGDPDVIMDLIDLRTEHGRAAHRAQKLAGQVIIATKDNFQFDESRPWRSGDQAKGAMGKFQVTPLGQTQSANWQFVFDDLFQQMILATGVDPRALTETKTKTATEAAIQRETSMRRLEQNIEFNEENGEVRMGRLIHKLIQQRYTKPEIVRLIGDESEQEIQSFDEVEEDGDTGIPLFGKRYRRIPTRFNVKESKHKKNLSKDDAGVSSFIARPEYIRTSDVDIQVLSTRRAGQIQSIEFEKNLRVLELVSNILPLTQPDPITGERLLNKDDLPNIKALVERLVKFTGLNPETDIGQGESGQTEKERQILAARDSMKQRELFSQPISAV